MPKTRGAWIGLALFVCVVLTVFTWFFFISPKFDERTELVAQEDALVIENNALERRVAALRAQFLRIEEFRAQLGQLQTRIPTTAQTDDLIDEIEAAAQKHDVIVMAVGAETGQSLAGDVAQLPEPKPTATESAESAESDKPAEPGADSTPAAPEKAPAPRWAADGPTDLVALPYKIEIEADYADALTFIEDLQTKDGRYFLVSDPVFTALDVEEADVTKELGITFTLFSFVLTEEGAAAPADDEEAEAKKPAKSKDNNFAVSN